MYRVPFAGNLLDYRYGEIVGGTIAIFQYTMIGLGVYFRHSIWLTAACVLTISQSHF